jgi:2'-5' RNA ligase
VARLFVAVVPPPDVFELVAALPRPPTVGVRWTTREQWHVTLRFLGRVDEVAHAVDALSTVLARPCEAVLGPAVARFGQRVVQVPVAGLDDVATAVVAATRDVGEPPEDRAFSGHLTLARSRDRGVDLRPLVGAPIAARWPVGEVVLMESQLHPHGARYGVVERFSLRLG